MSITTPASAEELASALAGWAADGKTIHAGGAFSKRRLGGPMAPAAATVSTAKLDKLGQYEPKDLTIRVGAGMKWSALTALLAENKQMVPLDPPFAADATVGGVVVANLCGPRRRWFGSARDLVIGMKFATLDGRIVQSGGMVVKNVAGLDMGKLMIGSLGTLAVVTEVNFKLTPVPPATRTFLFSFAHGEQAWERRTSILASVLQPWAIDVINPHAAARLGVEGWVLAIQVGGSENVVRRWTSEMGGARVISDQAESSFWHAVQEFTPEFLKHHENGCVVRLSAALSEFDEIPAPAITRAGSGVTYAWFADSDGAHALARRASAVVEFHGSEGGAPGDLWPNPGADLALMKNVKDMFDPKHLLNRGRLYGRI